MWGKEESTVPPSLAACCQDVPWYSLVGWNGTRAGHIWEASAISQESAHMHHGSWASFSKAQVPRIFAILSGFLHHKQSSRHSCWGTLMSLWQGHSASTIAWALRASCGRRRQLLGSLSTQPIPKCRHRKRVLLFTQLLSEAFGEAGWTKGKSNFPLQQSQQQQKAGLSCSEQHRDALLWLPCSLQGSLAATKSKTCCCSWLPYSPAGSKACTPSHWFSSALPSLC